MRKYLIIFLLALISVIYAQETTRFMVVADPHNYSTVSNFEETIFITATDYLHVEEGIFNVRVNKKFTKIDIKKLDIKIKDRYDNIDTPFEYYIPEPTTTFVKPIRKEVAIVVKKSKKQKNKK